MSTFEIACEHCQSRYALPSSLREALRGRTATCVVCMKEWVPVPREGGSLGPGNGTAAAQPPIALHHYLQSNPYSYVAEATAENQISAAANGSSPNLRVVAEGPDLRVEEVFALGRHAFLVGRTGCHLDLRQAASLPDRAIRVAIDQGGFSLTGVGGFLVPIGPISVAAGRLDPGARLEIAIPPYRLTFEPSAAPGKAVHDLEGPAGAPPSPKPAPAEAPADMSQTVRGLGSMGFDTRRFNDPLELLEVGLLGLDPPLAGESFRIRKSPALVGRTNGDILIADPRVSGKHAQIDILAVDQYAIKDLASTNGTTVNDRPASTTRLQDGDVVGLGGVRLRFVVRAKKRA